MSVNNSLSADALVSLKAMAADSRTRHLIIKDPILLGGLVMVLSNPDVKIVTTALEALVLLAEVSDFRAALCAFIGLSEQVENLMNKDQEQVGNLAEKLFDLLSQKTEKHAPLKDSFNTSGTRPRHGTNSKTKSNGRTKHIILQIRGLIVKNDKDVIMRLLLQVKGVISITFDLNQQRCILRTKQDVKPETLAQAVAKSQTMTAQQVVKDENGEEKYISFGSNMKEVDKENMSLPSYLPEDVDSPKANSKPLARNKPDDNKAKGWLSTATNFLTNSFYW